MKRGYNNIFLSGVLFLTSVLSLFSCKDIPGTVRATGYAGELILVMDSTVQGTPMGDSLVAMLKRPIDCFPNYEPIFSLTICTPDNFDKIFRVVRNILLVDISSERYTKTSVAYTFDHWAEGQVFVTIKTPSLASLGDFISSEGDRVIDIFKSHDERLFIQSLSKTYSSYNDSLVSAQVTLHINSPEDMKYNKIGSGFVWLSDNGNLIQNNIILFSYPYIGEECLSTKYIITALDDILKRHIPGSFPGSYMTIDTVHFDPLVSVRTIYKQKRIVVKGLWKMVGDMMGGPFVLHAFYDHPNNRIIIADAFIYGPDRRKRNHFQRLEATLCTVRVDSLSTFDEELALPNTYGK